MEDQQPAFLEQLSPEDWANTPADVKSLVEELLRRIELSEGENRLIQFLDATPIGIAVHDLTGQIVYLNDVGRACLGIEGDSPTPTAEQLSTVFQVYRDQTLYPADELPSARALAGEAAWADDIQVHRGDRRVPLEVWATPIFDNQGQVIYAIVAFQDISDRKRREQEQQVLENTLLSRERRYLQLIQAQTDLILRSLPDTTITFANAALCSALGLPLEDVIGLQWSRFVPPDDVEALHRKIAALTPANPLFENINRDYRANGQIGWTQWINLGIFDARDRLVEIQSVGRDITVLQQQIQREQALNRVFQAIRNSLDLDTIFATATAETAQLLKNLDCFVVQYLPQQGVWRHVAEFRHSPESETLLGLEIPDRDNLFADQLKQRQVVRVADTPHLHDAINQAIAQNLPGAWLLIPLVIENRLWGSFTLSTSQQPFTWRNEQVALAQAVANQLEVAIQQANLYQQVQLELAERSRIEAELRESEARFQNMAANVPGAIFRYVLRPDGSDGVLYMSAGCFDLWEVEAEAVVADATILWQMVHPDDLPAMQASVIASAQTLEPWSFAWRIIPPSGQQKWLEAAGRPTQQGNGDIIWDTLILDVTERKQAQQRFQTLAANMPGVIYQYVLRPDGSDVMLYVSPGCQDLWELPPAAIEQDVTAVWRMVHPDDLAAMRASVMASAQTLNFWSFEWRIVTPSGRQKWLQASARPQRQANGDILWDGLILDISDRKAAERRLIASENKFRSIFDHAAVGIIRASLQGNQARLLSCNPCFCQMLGYTAAELAQLTMAAVTHPDDQAMPDLPRLIAGEIEHFSMEKRYYRKDGSIMWAHTTISLVHDDGGYPTSTVVVVQDISDRKEAEAALWASENRFQNIADNVPGVLFGYRLRPDGTDQFTYISSGFRDLYGFGPESALQDTQVVWEMTHPDDLAHLQQSVMDSYQTLETWQCQYRVITPSGELKWLQGVSRPTQQPNGDVIWDGLIIDISDRKHAEEALRESEARYRLLAENANDLICLHDLEGRYLYISPSCESLLGYRCDELLHREPYGFMHASDRDRVYQQVQAAATDKKPISITYQMRHKSGHYIWFETLTKPILDDAGNIVQLQTTSRDVTERVQVQNQLQYDALHDGLTGLPNRHFFMERLELAINRAKRAQNYQFAVLFLDLDRFKVVNDSLGHFVGDQLLVTIAQKLQRTLRGIDLAARLGGDEFVVLLEDVSDIQDAVRVAERMFAELRLPLFLEERRVYTTASIGIVLGADHYDQADQILRDADIAMYRAKSKGKARYEIFDADMHAQALNRLHLENDLRRAIEQQEFVLHYQPIVALATETLVGFEALIRWQHPTRGLLSPSQFVAIAEEIGLITALDCWALRTACRQLATWQAAFPEFATVKISVNLSAQGLQHSQLLAEVDRTLAETQLEGHCLTLEITESMLIEDVESTIELLSQLKARGIQISIDDFGTGYSSLSYLHRLPVDSLKVDRAFVNQMQEGRRNCQIVATIMALTEQLGLEAIAEGIETPQQLERLKTLGYALGQGYLFARSLSQAAATALLASQSTM